MLVGRLTFSLVTFVTCLSLLINLSPIANAIVNQDRYRSVLTGDQIIPPVKTDAVSYIGLKYADDTSKVVYTVNAKNIRNVTGIYIYSEDGNQNDTMILDLLKAERKHKSDDVKIFNITSEGKISGTLSVGGATMKESNIS